jgi:hypothetical protein
MSSSAIAMQRSHWSRSAGADRERQVARAQHRVAEAFDEQVRARPSSRTGT